MVTYGNGKVTITHSIKGFDLRYKGNLNITEYPESMLLSAKDNRVVGVMLNGNDLPETLFDYTGNFQIVNFTGVTSTESYRIEIKTTEVGFYYLDEEKWEDDTSFWETPIGTFNVGSPKAQDKRKIILNDRHKDLKDSIKQQKLNPRVRKIIAETRKVL